MFRYHFRLMGICCFVTDVLSNVFGQLDDIRDRALENCFNSLPLYEVHFTRARILGPAYSYSKRVVFQFPSIVGYHELDIYSFDVEECISIEIVERIPSFGDIYGSFNGIAQGTVMHKMRDPDPSLLTRQIKVYTKNV